ncbi:DUF2163 domain-containing protein [Rhizobium sp. TRM95111]|uniref:DUF2163 domain-containing protein n=1 Tax=Rhizobium alarense TaxID=2846851 RepID=UPI001F3D7998|nr:DUF2163 domain-containing protein [Rhizobium alarense]MCF3642597.1 DUF2163 domain-containing protein [Rhizobium alarense]
MRTISDGLADHLATPVTTVCHAWRVTRRDGTVLGFTEHDRDLTFAGTTFRAASGFQASDAEAAADLSSVSGEVAGAFSADAIGEDDLAAGRYDGARVELFLVNWQDVDQRLLLRVGEIGEVTRAGGAFRAELRRLTHALDRVSGRIYGHGCDADFGDPRCGMNADAPAWRGEGSVTTIRDATHLKVAGLGDFSDRFFRYGVLTFTGGANDGAALDVADHRRTEAGVDVTLWLPPPLAIAEGDPFRIVAGCDKRFSTCRQKFANALNFRGFPHMPGSDFTYGYADGETVHDGRPLHD